MSVCNRVGQLLAVLALGLSASAAELHAPAQVKAGSGFTISSNGSGTGTFYLVGPAQISKRKVDLGAGITVLPEEVEHAGRYTAVVCDSDCTAVHFDVQAADPHRLSFLVHPSRVPVADPNAMSAVALVFDQFNNLEQTPETVTFSIIPKDGAAVSEERRTDGGIAWVRLTSGHREGATRIAAAIGKNEDEVRIVQQIASDACNLRIRPEWVAQKFFVETDPVRDCSGNNVPDGTVVSLTMTDADGKTTVDVPIKKGIAKVEMPIAGAAHITVASGVVTGNDLNVSGKQ
jgi:hypothetical protein